MFLPCILIIFFAFFYLCLFCYCILHFRLIFFRAFISVILIENCIFSSQFSSVFGNSSIQFAFQFSKTGTLRRSRSVPKSFPAHTAPPFVYLYIQINLTSLQIENLWKVFQEFLPVVWLIFTYFTTGFSYKSKHFNCYNLSSFTFQMNAASIFTKVINCY